MTGQAPYWLCADRIFDGARLRDQAAVLVEDGIVRRLSASSGLPAGAVVRRIRGTLTPGFLDLQVNGGGGVLFNATPTTAGIEAMVAAHRGLGTVGILATVITDAPEVLDRAVGAVRDGWGMAGLLGIHIEGPHISAARRGTHAEAHLRPFDETTFAHVASLRGDGIPVMITIAPEAVSAAEIARLAQTGATVSIGHTDATCADVRAALGAGATCFTHLFNAMSQLQNRAPGAVGAAITSHAYAGFICDGIHVDDAALQIAIRARPEPDRMFLVSDAMPTVGGPDTFDLYGQRIALRAGRLVNAENSLAGAHTTMAEGVARLVGTLGLPLQDALRMALTVPSRVMSLDLDRIEGRALRDLIVLDADLCAGPVPDGIGPAVGAAHEA